MQAARINTIRDDLHAGEFGGKVRAFERQADAMFAHRRTTRAPLALGDIELDVSTRRLRRAGSEIKLPKRGFLILLCLMGKPKHIFSRAQLRDFVWGRGANIDDRTVDAHIGRLRKALGSTRRASPIKTARGAGYFLAADSSGSGKRTTR